MLLKFPLRAGDGGKRRLANSAIAGLMVGRDEALGMLEAFERERAQKGAGLDARRTLEEFRARVEKLTRD